jgi:hypothetical protein
MIVRFAFIALAAIAAIAAIAFGAVVRGSDTTGVDVSKPHQAFMGYWLGYVQGGAPLQATPASVGIVALAFAVTSPGSDGDTITLDFLTSQHPAEEVRAGVKALQARGVKVVMSINGKPNWPGHAGGWDNLDPEVFAANVKAIVVDQWGLDGVDLDHEAGEVIPGENFVQVVKALRRALGPGALLTLPVYRDPAQRQHGLSNRGKARCLESRRRPQGRHDAVEPQSAIVGAGGDGRVVRGHRRSSSLIRHSNDEYHAAPREAVM